MKNSVEFYTALNLEKEYNILVGCTVRSDMGQEDSHRDSGKIFYLRKKYKVYHPVYLCKWSCHSPLEQKRGISKALQLEIDFTVYYKIILK